VVVDVAFDDETLIGARPDLRVDGVIELEKLNDILKLKRPVFTQENSSSSLFVLDKSELIATRQQVDFGRGSVDMIEVKARLNEGDQVVVSSTKKYDNLNQLTLSDNSF
jgi:HlyD family secretion protein